MDKDKNENVMIELSKIQTVLHTMQKDIDDIKSNIITITKSSDKVDSHIDFIEDTWNTFKSPLYVIKDTVEKHLGVSRLISYSSETNDNKITE